MMHNHQGKIARHKIVPLPIDIGRFTYDPTIDLVTEMNDTEAQLWGWDKSQPIRYCDVIALVDDPTSFMEQTISHNESWVLTKPIHIKNGNVVKEALTYTYHSEDYERRSLTKIEGQTIFIRAA
jgi:hypothetical protein